MKLLLVVLSSVVVFALAGCGGDQAAVGPTTTVAAPTTAPLPSAPFCGQVVRLEQLVGSPPRSPEALEALRGRLAELAAAAPEELSEPLGVWSASFLYLGQVSVDGGDLKVASESYDQRDAVVAAMAQLKAWTTENCPGVPARVPGPQQGVPQGPGS